MKSHNLSHAEMLSLLKDVKSWPEVMNVTASRDLLRVTVTFWPVYLPRAQRFIPPTRYKVDFSYPEGDTHYSYMTRVLDSWGAHSYDGRFCHNNHPVRNENPYACFHQLRQWHLGTINATRKVGHWWESQAGKEFLRKKHKQAIVDGNLREFRARHIRQATYERRYLVLP